MGSWNKDYHKLTVVLFVTVPTYVLSVLLRDNSYNHIQTWLRVYAVGASALAV